MINSVFSLTSIPISREVARAVARIIALALDLESDFFDRPEMLSTDPIAVLRLIHYEGKSKTSHTQGISVI